MNGTIDRDTLIARIACELRDLTIQVAQIEDTLTDMSDRLSSPARQVIQELDRVRQTQESLAICLEQILPNDTNEAHYRIADMLDGQALPSVVERLRTGTTARLRQDHQEEPEIW